MVMSTFNIYKSLKKVSAVRNTKGNQQSSVWGLSLSLPLSLFLWDVFRFKFEFYLVVNALSNRVPMASS